MLRAPRPGYPVGRSTFARIGDLAAATPHDPRRRVRMLARLGKLDLVAFDAPGA